MARQELYNSLCKIVDECDKDSIVKLIEDWEEDERNDMTLDDKGGDLMMASILDYARNRQNELNTLGKDSIERNG
jgi:Cft2 family RNA processing exonuclease